GEGGTAPSDLDECLGHEGATPEFPDGMYHYHLSETSPYMMTCYHGVVDDAGGMPGGPPPGGVVE
ncbi:MAG: YHYH protein, partial [Myxococcota bacterium]